MSLFVNINESFHTNEFKDFVLKAYFNQEMYPDEILEELVSDIKEDIEIAINSIGIFSINKSLIGYMPDGERHEFPNFKDAKEALIEEIKFYYSYDDTPEDEFPINLANEIKEAIDYINDQDEPYIDIIIGNTHFWLHYGSINE